jgi:hypothetical protein
MNDYKVHENQSLLDVSAHVYGSTIYAVALSIFNNISLTDNLVAGQIIKLSDFPVNKLVLKSVESRNIIPATNTTEKSNLDFLGFAYEFAISL